MANQPSNTLAGNGGVQGENVPVTAPGDDELLRRCKDGQRDAFGMLVKRYQDRLFNTILRLCGNRDDAEELSQETFVKALENLNSFRQASQFYTWLFRIAVNLTITRRRRESRIRVGRLETRRADGEQAYRYEEIIADHRQHNPHDAVVSADINRRIEQALMKLDDEFRTVVVLCDIEHMDYAEISRVLDVPIGTVKSRIYRARKLLRDELSDLVEQE